MSKEDVATPVLEALKREFFGMMKTKNQQYIDNKVRNVRYLAELVKFGVAPPITAFRMFKTMMADFSPHNIELVAILLESCGRCGAVPRSDLPPCQSVSPNYLYVA
jgi:regulator of nonsense transcripts 2